MISEKELQDRREEKPEIKKDLTNVLKTEFDGIENMVLIIDKGNNSKDNFENLNGNIEWVGSLKISDYTDLTDFPIDHYDSIYKDYVTIRCEKGKLIFSKHQ